MSGKPDPSPKLPPAEPHWPEIRAWLQANPPTLLDDRSLLEEIGLKPHGRNVVEFGRAALTRLEDHGADGIGLLEEIRVLYDVHGFDTQILAASLRNPNHVSAAAVAGADAATIPADVFRALVKHPLTDKGLDAFLADWGKTGQSIL